MLLNGDENAQAGLEAELPRLKALDLRTCLVSCPMKRHLKLFFLSTPLFKPSLLLVLSSRGFHNNNIKAIPEKAFMGSPLLQTM
jgi:hypothetical protein